MKENNIENFKQNSKFEDLETKKSNAKISNFLGNSLDKLDKIEKNIEDGPLKNRQKMDIKKQTGRNFIGVGSKSIVLSDSKDKVIGLNYYNKEYNDRHSYQKPEKNYKELTEQTFFQKNRYYSNKILTILFPNNFAKLHATTAGMNLSENAIQSVEQSLGVKIPKNLSPYSLDKRQFIQEPKLYDKAKYLKHKSRFIDIVDLLGKKIEFQYDSTPSNVIKNRQGHEVYIDDALLVIKNHEDINEIVNFMNSQNEKTPSIYSDKDIDIVKNYANRMKELSEEYSSIIVNQLPPNN